jgi:hypothetical protein
VGRTKVPIQQGGEEKQGGKKKKSGLQIAKMEEVWFHPMTPN